MGFDADETSIEDSRPRDGYVFELPLVTYRFTSGTRPLVIDGQRFRPETIRRGSIKLSTGDGSPGELEIEIIATHPLVRSLLSTQSPSADVTVYRQQLTSGEHELAWTGRIVATRCSGRVATMLVVQSIDRALTRRIPTITVGRDCAHVLYDSRCTINRNLFRIDTTVALANGRDVTVASIDGHPDQWAQFGELWHVASGERISITSQIGTALQIHMPLSMQAGDAVQVYAGCDHTIETCRTKFANHLNFGGIPDLPRSNPFGYNSYAVFRPVY